MEKCSILLVGLALFSVAVSYSSADTKVGLEANVVSSSSSNSNFTDIRLGGSELITNDTKGKNIEDESKQSDSRENGELGDDSMSRGRRDGTIKEGLSSFQRKKKDGFHGEECDPSNMCRDKEDEFVACLRVPGNDSPHLSLLIQNKGKSPLLVTISASANVQLEKNKVQLLKSEDQKVKVFIKDRESNDKAIILSAGKGRCSLDWKELYTQNDDSIALSRTSIMNLRSQTLIVIIFIAFAIVVVLAFIYLYRNKSVGNQYQRVDGELPISSDGAKTEEGWNNDWGDDDWDQSNDDEEAVKTPLVAVTPRFSSRGLASRRLSKEGWKD